MATVLSRAIYPGLDPKEAGLLANTGYGNVDDVRCHLVEGGATALLSAAISPSAASLTVSDPTRFPAAPFTIQIGSELMSVTASNGAEFTVTRAQGGTTARAHSAGRTVYEVLTEYVWLAADHPVKSISKVYVDGQPQQEGYTAYTGKSGSEHPGYPGKAVIAFSAEPWVSKQRNLTEADGSSKISGKRVTVAASSASGRELTDGSDNTYRTAGGNTAPHIQWAAFPLTVDTVLSRTYSARVKNPGSSERTLWLAVSSGGTLLKRISHCVRAGATAAVSLTIDGADSADTFALVPDGSVYVYSMTKTLTIAPPLDAEPLAECTPAPGITMWRVHQTLSPSARHSACAGYADGEGAPASQTHRAVVTEQSGSDEARVRLAADGCAFTELTVRPGVTETLALSHEGGSWQTPSALVALKGKVTVESLGKTVYTSGGALDAAASPASSSTARAVIGSAVTVDARWSMDDAGVYITRPDKVIRYYLINQMGFGDGDIDSASFDAAGSSYGSAIVGGYKLAFIAQEGASPSTFVRSLAMQCRSTLSYRGGKWRLTYLPDTAPAAVRTLGDDDLAGQGEEFVFSHTTLNDLANQLNARYARRYAASSSSDSAWQSTATVGDTDSQALYGLCSRELTFSAVRDSVMAGHVLAHMLRARKRPLMRVEFSAHYRHADLAVGDTIAVDSPLAAGKRFFIEEARHTGHARIAITALEWWA